MTGCSVFLRLSALVLLAGHLDAQTFQNPHSIPTHRDPIPYSAAALHAANSGATNDHALNALTSGSGNSQWTWMGGSSTLGNIFGQTGVYGTLGTPAPGNIPSGRQYSATWVDGRGNLWLFGGGGIYTNGDFDYLNDLWEFNPSTNEWAWMSGSDTVTCGSTVCGPSGSYGALNTPAVGNVPGGRQSAVSWIDSKGNLWLFGGYGFDASGNIGFLNDLWEFNPSTVEWAWMGGGNAVNQPGVYGAFGTFAAGNIPPARETAMSWIDDKGNFWLFGGNVNGSNLDASLNDLWEYSPATNEWAWVGGSSAEDQTGTSGVLGTPAAGNIPGSRFGSAEWTDNQGNFWLCGGYGYDADGYDYLNDVWEFSPSTGEWAWMGGANTDSEYAVYGTLGTAAAGNIPGSRYSASNWTDLDGNLWLFGGFGFTVSFPPSFLNDLWELNLSTSQWAWMSGSDQTEQPGVYGELGVPAPGNTPGARYAGLNWTDHQGNFWLFGGLGEDANGTEGVLNDLWEYRPTLISLPVAATPSFSPPAGNYSAAQKVIISDTTPSAVIYYTTDGSTPTTTSSVYSTAISVSATETLNAVATATGYSNSAIATAIYNIDSAPAATPTFSVPAGTYNAPQSVTISDTTPGAVIYYTTDGTTPTTASAVYSAAITVSISETLQAMATATGYSPSQVASNTYIVTASTSGAGEWAWMGGIKTLQSSNDGGIGGVYGTMGTASAANMPGSRGKSTTWTDGNGNLWLFGGGGVDSAGNWGSLNDLWKYDISTGEWTWMSGSNTLPNNSGVGAQPGVYGSLGVPAAGNVPGGRSGALGFTDTSGNLWLFGGIGDDSAGINGYLNDLWKFNPTTSEWTWAAGSSTLPNTYTINSAPGVYGTLGVFAPGNTPGGRLADVGWTDPSGNFWLFGANQYTYEGLQGALNDLWEFVPSKGEWAWISGSDAMSCSSSSGSLQCTPPAGVYGSVGVPAAGNTPGSRGYSTSWVDGSGNLWLYGGVSNNLSPSASLPTNTSWNDLWEFDPATREWTWMGGSSTENNCITNGGVINCGQQAVYGALGVFAAANTPGSLSSANGWTDNAGNFWLFGGQGPNSAGDFVSLNSLWEFNPSANEWAWIDGSNAANQPGVYGALGVPASANTPGARVTSSAWTDRNGNFWLFGGWGFDSVGALGYPNDLWRYGTAASTLPVAATPTFSIPAGSYNSPQTVTISDTTADAVIYYTTDGSAPTNASTVYSTAITVTATETLNAIATATGYSNSTVASATYTIAAQICSSTSAINVDYFTVAETDQDENRGIGGVSTNYVMPTLGANGLPVYNPNATGTPFVPEDLLSDGEITWWSPALNKGGPGGTSDVVETGIASVTLPFSNDNFFPPNGTGPNDANGFQAAVLTGNLYAPAAETVSFTVSSDDSAFVYLDGQIACDDGGVHSATAVPCTTSTISAGTHTIQVFYIDLRETQAALDLTVTTSNVCVNPVGSVPTITWPTPAPILYGTPLSSVQLDASSGGVAGSFAYTPPAGTVLPAGVHTLSTTFTPTDTTDYTDAIATVQLTVNQITPVITWPTPAPITYGTSLSSAQLDATSTVPGTFVYTPAAGTVLPGGVQTLSVTFTPTDATDYATVTATVNLTVLQAGTTMQLSASTTSVPAGTPFTLTATVNDSVSQTPTGTVTFYNGGSMIGTAPLANGVATYTLALTTLGTSTMTASYPGNANFLSAQSNSVAITVLAATTSNLLTASPNPDPVGGTVTFTSTLSSLNGTPTGSVTFYDGTASLAVVPLVSGVAQFSTNALAVGSHNITSVYAGSPLFSASTSNIVVEVVEDFGIAASPDSQTVYTGVAAPYTVTISALPGFNLPVALSCFQLPANTTCTFSPATISGGSLSSKLVIQTTAPSKTKTVSGLSTKVGVPLLAGFFLLLIPRRFRRHRNGSFIFFALFVSIVIGAAFTGCGSPSAISGGTPVGTQIVTVIGTATNGTQTLTHTATVTLNVKSLF